MEIVSTLGKRRETVKAPKSGQLRLFVCGPTVYDYSHIGHARTYLVFDAFARYLKSKGLNLYYLQNITDIDDKIIVRAKESGEKPLALARRFEKEYLKDMKALGITSVTKYARATDHVKEIVAQIETLLKKGYAYKIEGDGYYFNLSTFPEYGKLSGRTTLEAEDAVSRVDESTRKKNKGDFALWKFKKEGEPSWKTKLGEGRPGWHIEDTAITEHYFGPQYDIHGGAVDLKFPHHEAEIAQQEAASGKKPFVKIWMHTGFLLVGGKKMSKSLGNFITIRNFPYEADILRMIVLSHHYSSPFDYHEKGSPLEAAKGLWGIMNYLEVLNFGKRKTGAVRIASELAVAEKSWSERLENDFNTPGALGSLYELIAALRRFQIANGKLNKNEAVAARKYILEKMRGLGFFMKSIPIPVNVKKRVKRRELMRKNKEYDNANEEREAIFKEHGYTIQDTPEGPFPYLSTDKFLESFRKNK